MAIKWVGSPNFDSNRKPIDRILIHWFGIGTLSSASARFQNSTEKASAHYGISENTIYQWVKEENVAWHAGVYSMNQRSIGIEHDATTDHVASEETYQTSGRLIADICKRWSIPLDREHIIKHSEVKATQCPGTIDLDKLLSIAKGEIISNTEIDKLKQTIIDLQKEVEYKNEQIGNYDAQVTGLNIELNEEKSARKSDLVRIAEKLGISDDIVEILKEVEKLIVAEEGLRDCLGDKRECEINMSAKVSELRHVYENLKLLSGYGVASPLGVEKALQSYAKLHGQVEVGDIASYNFILKLFGNLIYRR